MVLVILVFALFSDSDDQKCDLEGIVHDVSSSSSGFIFYIDTEDSVIRCFFREMPESMGWYGISGSFSDDGSIFFVDGMKHLDPER